MYPCVVKKSYVNKHWTPSTNNEQTRNGSLQKSFHSPVNDITWSESQSQAFKPSLYEPKCIIIGVSRLNRASRIYPTCRMQPYYSAGLDTAYTQRSTSGTERNSMPYFAINFSNWPRDRTVSVCLVQSVLAAKLGWFLALYSHVPRLRSSAVRRYL